MADLGGPAGALPQAMGGAPAGVPPKPGIPGNIAGGPQGAGPSPIASSGDGAGKQAAADAVMMRITQEMLRALSAYPVGSDKQQAIMDALKPMMKLFSRAASAPLQPVAAQAMAQQTGKPMETAPPGTAMGGGGPSPMPGIGNIGGPG